VSEAVDLCFDVARGDGEPDFFYPWWQLEGASANHPLDGRTYMLSKDGRILVHVADLREGDLVSYGPSRFDYEFLDITGRRREVNYLSGGRRPERPWRPYLLEEIPLLRRAWDLMYRDGRGLSTSQMEALSALIESRRDAGWERADAGTFAQFVRDALANAGDGWWDNLEPHERLFIEDWAQRGRLGDVMEWFTFIGKREEPV
jgi:hypothetical protein